ncbi:transglutaminaseTgpA domain-containing protein [Catenovulum adriaticum]|uniref:TransglutaminaseTgpA domain-containing protein n=1 Tax=Catenovulum adriaticum TaxID=2984846 RepID=A0ABY7APC7_9ALTE|nr:transglutaminaseTgpA domain-containing protein [Catenovulum sp. TS8]WAJ71413.1 transglutaminaseTgpA domain-containing protein [Catenovulum sp. TS8]
MKIKNQNHVQPISLTSLILFIAGNLITLFYQAFETSFYPFCFALACMAIRLYAYYYPNFKLKKRHLITLYVFATAILISSYFAKDILTSLFAMLICLQSLSIANMKQGRELKTCAWVLLFLVAANLLFYPQFYHVLILFFAITLALSSLYSYSCQITSLKTALAKLSQIAILALPVAAILFLVMPRLPPLWQMPKTSSQTRGLHSEIKFGDIAELSQSNNLAFRANFNGQVPNNNQLYWRAFVLQQFDGDSWQRSDYMKRWQDKAENEKIGTQTAQLSGKTFDYQIVTEASFQNWLFALDLASSQHSQVVSLPDFSLYSTEKLTQKFQYQVTSYPQANLVTQDKNQIKLLNLQLPKGDNPKTRQWLAQLKQQTKTDAELIKRILAHFNQQAFYYSTKPPKLQAPNKIDDFIFNTQTGFCEHYASAFAYVMRLADIPARIVAGYLGGEYNPTGGYYSVYQFDAHAWVEIWQADTGWTRIDPTAYVAPDRIEFDLRQAIGNDNFLADRGFSLLGYDQINAIKNIRLLIANLDYQWTLWVLNYNNAKQKDIFNFLFGKSGQWFTQFIILIMVISLLAFLTLIAWWLASQKSHNSKLDKLSAKACKILEKKYAIHKQTSQTFNQINLSTVTNAKQAQIDSHLNNTWADFCYHFEQLKYAKLSDTESKYHYKNCKRLLNQL